MPDYGPLYQAAGNQFNIDPLLLQSMAVQESTQGRNQGPSTAGAQGFMQFLPQTAAKYGVDTQDATSSVFGASNYMNDLMNQHGESLAHALADYGGTTPDSKYVSDVMGRYNTLKAAWAKTGPGTSGAGPTTDTDPTSPTFGQSTGKNFTPPPSTPGADTTAKGNAGQPSSSVPTTDTPGISMATAPGTTFAPPQAGGPKGQRQAAPTPAQSEKNDPLSQAKPHVNEDGTPITPAQAAPAEANDPLSQAQPHVNEDGTPITAQPAMDTGEYLSAPQSLGAKAVMPLGGPLEGFELGPGAQAKIGTASDPMQRVRIAASEAGVTPDSIIVGADNRLAAVGPNGVPYYLTPQRIFANQEGITKAPGPWWDRGESTDQGPNLAQLGWSGSRAVSDNANAPPGDWRPMGAFQVSPYATQSPLAPNAPGSFAPANLVRGGAAALPAAAAQVPMLAGTAIGEAMGGPAGGAAGTSLGYGLGQGARQWLANRFDPDNATAPYPVTGETVRNALFAGATYAGGRLAGDILQPGETTVLRPTDNRLYNRPQPITRQQPYGLQDKLFPWESPQRWELPPTQGGKYLLDSEPPAPSSPVPWTVPPGEAAPEAAGVPQVKTDAQIAAEDRAIPQSVPPLRFPLISDQAYKDRAAEIVRNFMQGGNMTPEPGAEGTLAEVTGNRGAAALLRLMRDRAGPVANEIGQYEDAQAAANREAVANLRGDEDQLTALRQARTTQTAALEQKALSSVTGPADPSDVQAVVEQQLGSRAAQDPNVAAALRDIHERLYQHDPLTGKILEDEAGNPQLQTDPEQLMGLRQSLAREMTRQAQSGRPDMRLASLQLAPVLDQLDTAITRAMPAYPEFNAAYREASKPITAMEYLQGRNLVDTSTGTPMLSAVQKTLDNIYQQRVLAHGWQPAQDLSQDQLDQLTALRDQLRRQWNIRKGMSIGPATYEKFATSQMTNMLMNPLLRSVRPIAAGALGVHEFGGLAGFGLGMGEAGLEHFAAQRGVAAQQRLNMEIAKLLLNRNGEGVAALQGP